MFRPELRSSVSLSKLISSNSNENLSIVLSQLSIYLALDPGLNNTGVAISYEGTLVEPLTTLGPRDLVKNTLHLLYENHVDVLIIGEPSHGPAKDLALILVDEIKNHFSCQIHLHPEDFSSKKATKKLIEAGTALMKRRSLSHSASAAIILEDYLESIPHAT